MLASGSIAAVRGAAVPRLGRGDDRRGDGAAHRTAGGRARQDGLFPADTVNGRVEAGLDALVEQVLVVRGQD